MQMIKPRAVWTRGVDGNPVCIVRCGTHVAIGANLDAAVARHRDKFISLVVGPKAIHRHRRKQ